MEDINVSELKERLENKGEKISILDVREPWEHDLSNIGGKNIPLGKLPDNIDNLEEYKDEELVVYCQTGVRSGTAKKFLEQKGFAKVRNLLGGIKEYLNS